MLGRACSFVKGNGYPCGLERTGNASDLIPTEKTGVLGNICGTSYGLFTPLHPKLTHKVPLLPS